MGRIRKPGDHSRDREVVFITGGARGLGLAIAEIYARRGCDVALCSRTAADLEEAKSRLLPCAPRVRVDAYVCDVADRESVRRTIDAVEHRLGPITTVVNAAGVIIAAPVTATGFADLEDAIDTNLRGTMNVCLTLAPRMIERRAGRILNVTSIGGLAPVPHLLAYGASKFGAVGFSTTLAIELRRYGVSVTTVAPALIRTGSFRKARFREAPDDPGSETREMSWFTRASTYLGLAMDTERVAGAAVRAADRRLPFKTIGWDAKVAHVAFALFPNLVIRAFDRVNRWLPGPAETTAAAIEDARAAPSRSGAEVQVLTRVRPQTAAGEAAVEKWNERGGSAGS